MDCGRAVRARDAAATALLFNGGLLVAGLLALSYAVFLARVGSGPAGVTRAVSFAVSGVALAGVGAFPTGSALHFPAAVGFYLTATGTMALHAAVNREAWHGRLSLGLVGLHLLAWAAWLAGVRPGPGLAILEFVGAALYSGWIWFASPGRLRVVRSRAR